MAVNNFLNIHCFPTFANFTHDKLVCSGCHWNWWGNLTWCWNCDRAGVYDLWACLLQTVRVLHSHFTDVWLQLPIAELVLWMLSCGDWTCAGRLQFCTAFPLVTVNICCFGLALRVAAGYIRYATIKLDCAWLHTVSISLRTRRESRPSDSPAVIARVILLWLSH